MTSIHPVDPESTEFLITRAGRDRLRTELETLLGSGRQAIADRLRTALENGGAPDENGALEDALEERRALEERISTLEALLASARVVAEAPEGVAALGTRVRVAGPDGEVRHYELVGPAESDAARSRISVRSPVGRALLGRRAGDAVEVEAPGRTLRLQVLDVAAIPAGAAEP